MLRRLHSLPGLVLAAALAFTAATGATLSVFPTLDGLSTPTIARGTSVAELAGAVAARHELVSAIRVRPTGVVTAFYLSAPEQRGKYDITIYQLGWRLGGKCATGRNAGT